MFWGWRHPFSSSPKIDKIVENLRKQNGKERTSVLCNRDVKHINIGSLTDKTARRGLQLQKGYQGQFQGSGKRNCRKDEADALRTIDVNTGNIYCHYKMHALTSMSVLLTV